MSALPVRRTLTALLLMALQCGAQTQLPFTVQKAEGSKILQPYRAPVVPPVRLYNSSRLQSVLRAGKLYLTVADAIALFRFEVLVRIE